MPLKELRRLSSPMMLDREGQDLVVERSSAPFSALVLMLRR